MPKTQSRRSLPLAAAFFLLASGAAALCPAQTTTTSAPADPPAGQLIEGIVVNHLGSGIAGATVRVEAADAAEDAPPLGTETTSKTGDIHVQLAKVHNGTVRVRIKKEGFATFIQELDLADETQQPWVDATLEGAGTLTGVVRDRLFNEPVKKAHVICANGGQDYEADTDDQGQYRFNTIAYGPATITCSAKGLATERKTTNIMSDDANADIELGPERSIEFKIITDDEKPAPDVRVEGVARPGGEYFSEKTGPDGKVVIHGIGNEAEELWLRLSGERYIHASDFDVHIPLKKEKQPAETETAPPASMPAIRQELIVHMAGKIKGTVTEIKTGDPIVGVRVIAGREFRSDAPMTWTSLDGTYELTGLPPGINVISYQHTSYATAIHEAHLDQEQIATIDLQLNPGLPIAGKVVDAAGKPVEQAFVSGDNWQGYSTLGLRGITDKEGKFSFPNAPNGEIEFSFVKPGYGRPVRQTLTAGQTNYSITLKVEAPQRSDPSMPKMSKLETGQPVPDMTLIDLAGTTYKLSTLRGKFVFLDCWATWCGPCMGEVENVKALHAALKDRADFVLIGISLDTDRDALKKTIESEKMPWPQVFGPKSGGREAFEMLNGVGIPYTCLIGPDGKILAQELRGPGLATAVKELMTKSAASKPAK